MAQYSAAAQGLGMVGCFLHFHEIRKSPRKTHHPTVEWRVSGHPAQSASAQNWRGAVEATSTKRKEEHVNLVTMFSQH